MLENFTLVQALAYAAHDLREEVKGVDVLENVGLLVGDEHHVELIKRLVNESDIVLFNSCVLGARVGGLGESGQEGLDSRPLDIVECTGENGLAAACADGRCKHHL